MSENITFDSPIANTKYGEVAGRFRNGVELFAGIPYASRLWWVYPDSQNAYCKSVNSHP